MAGLVTLLLSILADDIVPIFAIVGVGFLLARHFDASVKTVSKVSFNALSPCLVFDQLVTSHITGSDFGRMALFCVLLTAAMGLAAWVAAIALRLDRQTLSSFLLVVMFTFCGWHLLRVDLEPLRVLFHRMLQMPLMKQIPELGKTGRLEMHQSSASGWKLKARSAPIPSTSSILNLVMAAAELRPTHLATK